MNTEYDSVSLVQAQLFCYLIYAMCWSIYAIQNITSFLHLQILNLLFMLLFAKIWFEILIKYLF